MTTQNSAVSAEEVAELGLRDPSLVTLSSGRTVRVRAVPPLLYETIQNQYPDPKPPKVETETLTGPEVVENASDPDYLAELGRVRAARQAALMRVFMLKGVEVELPADDEWLEELDLIGVPRPRTAAERRLAYVRYELIRSAADMEAITLAVGRMSGATEEGIAAAAAKFRPPVPGPAAE